MGGGLWTGGDLGGAGGVEPWGGERRGFFARGVCWRFRNGKIPRRSMVVWMGGSAFLGQVG